MPLTPKGEEILSNMEKQYGAKKGKSVFYASANKGTIKGVHHSPDRFEPDAIRAEAPPRIEYHGTPENLNTAETKKMAGQSRGKIQESDGTDNLRANAKVKSAAMPTQPDGGESATPGDVSSFKESNADRP